MSEPQELRKRSHTWTWVAVVVALLVLYVLSIGPAYALAIRTAPAPIVRHTTLVLAKPQWYLTAYGPVENWAKAAGCGDWLWNYQKWWLDRVYAWAPPSPP